MSQKTRMAVTSLVMLVLAAGAGAYAWYGVHEPKKAKAAKDASEARLLPKDLGDVTKVVIARPGDRVVLEKSGEKDWKITEPKAVDADAGAVRELLSRLKDASRKTFVSSAEEAKPALATYGLKAPRLTVDLGTAKGEHEVRFGRENGFDHTVYVQVGDGPVNLFPQELFTGADKKLFDLREKRLLRFESADVKKLDVELDGGSYELTRTPKGWEVSGIANDRADTATVRTLLSSLSGLRAIAFPDAVVPASLDAPEALVRIDLDSGASLDLSIAKPKAKGDTRLYATGSGVTGVAQIAADFASRLHKGAFDLRYKKILDVDREAVAKIEVRSKDGTYTLAKSAGEKKDAGTAASEWKVVGPKAEAVKQWRVSSMLYTLSDLEASSFPVEKVDASTELAKFGLKAPERTVTAWDGEGKVLGVLKLGSQPQGHKDRRYVANGKGERIYEVPETRVSGLPWKLADVVDTPVAAKGK